MRVLALCNRTRNMVRPWLEAGHEAVTVDMQPADVDEPGRTHIVADVREFRPEGRFDMVFAFPPCTHLAVSGARWFRDKGLPKLIEALQIVNACREICEDLGAPYMIENPVGTLKTYWRDPDHTFNPCDYALYSPEPEEDAYTKRTCLWTGHGFIMPQPAPVAPVKGSAMHRLPPSADRGDLRSVTPLGLAYAVFEANAPYLARAA